MRGSHERHRTRLPLTLTLSPRKSGEREFGPFHSNRIYPRSGRMTPAAIPLLPSIAGLSPTCDAWIVDIWGVMHNGARAFDTAGVACRKFRAARMRAWCAKLPN